MTQSIADQVEAEVIWLSRRLTEPGERECLRCFLMRMIDEFGCDGTHRWTERWRAERAPRARALLRRLNQMGGCCDCEVVTNVYPEYPDTSHLLPCAGQPQADSAGPCDLRTLRRSA